MRIGVSGDIGSFSEEAAIKYIRKCKLENAKIECLVFVETVLESLEKKKIDLGIFPIENSIGGVVLEAVNAMGNHLFNIKEFFDIEINHNLMIKKEANKEDIKKIASHDQALRQCKTYLKKKFPRARKVDGGDTAKSAKDLRDGRLSEDTAIIAPLRCAKIYNLKIIEKNIQDLKTNFTTFLAVTKK